MSPPESPTLPDPGPIAWVFGYGSLMWRPGFAWVERRPAVLEGYHRAFCRYSFRHRGTRERPGLVVGLRPGGRCPGVAYRIAPEDAAAALAYLDEREGAGYLRTRVAVALQGADGNGSGTAAPASVQAWTYVPNPEHPSYFGRTDHAHIVRLVAGGVGESGTAYDYLRELVDQMRLLGVEEPELLAVLADVEHMRSDEPSRAASRG